MAKLSFADMHNPKKIDWTKADQYIKASMAVGIFMFVVNLLLTLSYGAVYAIDLVIIAGLTFGVYKKNFPAAVIFAVYFLLSKLFIFSAGGVHPAVMGLSIVLLYFTVLGAIGTYKYKTEKRK
jgi:hypothetical protein